MNIITLGNGGNTLYISFSLLKTHLKKLIKLHMYIITITFFHQRPYIMRIMRYKDIFPKEKIIKAEIPDTKYPCTVLVRQFGSKVVTTCVFSMLFCMLLLRICFSQSQRLTWKYIVLHSDSCWITNFVDKNVCNKIRTIQCDPSFQKCPFQLTNVKM